MAPDFRQEKPEQASIFRCQNGYGIEVISAKGSGDDDEEFMVRRYVASSLTEALDRVRDYFLEGETNE